MNKIAIIVILTAAGCGMIPRAEDMNPLPALVSMPAPAQNYNFAGQSVSDHVTAKNASVASAKTCKPFIFTGFEIHDMSDVYPRANRIVVEVMGRKVQATNCFNQPISLVWVDFDDNGAYDGNPQYPTQSAYKAALANQTLWVPSDMYGSELVIYGLSCDAVNRCTKLWMKTVIRNQAQVQEVRTGNGQMKTLVK